MVWTAPITFYDGDPLTVAQLNIFMRDNFLETEVAKATTNSRLISGANVNEIVETQWARAHDTSSFLCERGWPSDEATEGDPLGPTATVQHQGAMLLFYDARMDMAVGSSANCMYGPKINGDAPENSNDAARLGTEEFARFGAIMFWEAEDNEPGLAEVTMMYGVSNNSSSAGYADRRISIIPM